MNLNALFVAIAFAILGMVTESEARCRTALALGLDVSDSVDANEYRFQLDGLAAALTRPDVVNAFLAEPNAPVRVFVFEWAGPGSQRRIVDWLPVDRPEDLVSVAKTLRERPRFELTPSTGLGEAMLYGGTALSMQPSCVRHVLDISGDGISNVGVLPGELNAAALPGITVNGLVVGTKDTRTNEHWWSEIADVHAYYATDVIRGPGAFVMVAASYRDFEEAMAHKLLRELQSFAIVHLDE